MNSHNNAYTIVSVVFFFTYTIFQAPATILIRKIGPRLFLAAIVLFWGATMIVSPTFLGTTCSLTTHRVLALCRIGKSCLASVLFSECLRLDSIRDASIFLARGTPDSTFRSATRAFTSSAAWHLAGEESLPMVSCR